MLNCYEKTKINENGQGWSFKKNQLSMFSDYLSGELTQIEILTNESLDVLVEPVDAMIDSKN